jgi:hypothetical protein
VPGDTTYERLAAKVPLSLVRTVDVSGGRMPGSVIHFSVRVETSPPFDEPVECDRVDLAEDTEGKNAAYRCAGTADWTVLRLRGGDRRVRECKAPVGTAKLPRFDALGPVRSAADRILACAKTDERYQEIELTRAVLEDEGAGGAIDVVSTLAARRPGGSDDPWNAALRVLDDASRAAVMAQVCHALAAVPPLSPSLFVRAARQCPFDAQGVEAGALAMLRARFSEGPPGTIGTGRMAGPDAIPRFAHVWAAVLASDKNPKEAAAAACAAAPGLAGAPRESTERRIVTELLVRAGSSCPAIHEWLEPPPCEASLDCDGGLCNLGELARDTERWREAARSGPDGDAGIRFEPGLAGEARMLLAIALLEGTLPRSLRIPNERRRYPFADAGDRARCEDATLDAGAPCRCGELPEYERCHLGLEETRLRYGYCSVRVDDAHRAMADAVRACEPAGAKCNWSSVVCCAGLRCKPGDAVCETEPPAIGRRP